jgi:zinc D-Ala-D-Ala dipeptidase
MPIRPYHSIAIADCNEPLIEIPGDLFALVTPHPYEKLGAPYGGHSPYFLRPGVVDKLIAAQNCLQQKYPSWKIEIFDAYRPVAVQQFMVDYSFAQALRERGLVESELTQVQLQELWSEVYKIWAAPSLDIKTPPPHSTGAAVDVTLVDTSGNTVDMGSPIDEMSMRSLPDYYLKNSHPQASKYQANRQLLCNVMEKVGFHRNPREWWHFSFGDQMWTWLHNEANPGNSMTAIYGRV